MLKRERLARLVKRFSIPTLKCSVMPEWSSFFSFIGLPPCSQRLFGFNFPTLIPRLTHSRTHALTVRRVCCFKATVQVTVCGRKGRVEKLSHGDEVSTSFGAHTRVCNCGVAWHIILLSTAQADARAPCRLYLYLLFSIRSSFLKFSSLQNGSYEERKVCRLGINCLSCARTSHQCLRLIFQFHKLRLRTLARGWAEMSQVEELVVCLHCSNRYMRPIQVIMRLGYLTKYCLL